MKEATHTGNVAGGKIDHMNVKNRVDVCSECNKPMPECDCDDTPERLKETIENNTVNEAIEFLLEKFKVGQFYKDGQDRVKITGKEGKYFTVTRSGPNKSSNSLKMTPSEMGSFELLTERINN